ncbi:MULTISPECIES: AI-2E family transporter [Staphylococcus]|jgi:predicted PurR-regulated permease PerM|uniref:AI-2E family transporter n=2 Tax=Staphylococcus nepalensis TaxID=214473 RepID=A0A291JKS5_9STAP|nr:MULTISPECIES: AI-2E family transporter [Staphylococcus]VDG67185.1 putative permease [Lacrimispora indolis]ATH60170.1 AI-2E family transporter [Staphylococcus nepalensis]ATH65260.1 AI-2E family transporter [Staphylococcus nepalensis]AWI44629.1 AI-2E family transporter [Staphylococcus nepalensis]MBO1204860.1 AI-2E family transporter [Staphylococcus nepalensis]
MSNEEQLKQDNHSKKRKLNLSFPESRFMKFIGGKDLAFALLILIFIGCAIFIFDQVSYIFKPFIIVFNTIIAPIIVSIILYYLFNPLVNLMERYNISRLWGVIILFLVIVGVIALAINLLIPVIGAQFKSFGNNFPYYVDKVNKFIDSVTKYSLISNFYVQIQDQLDSLAKKLPSMVSDYFNGFGSKVKNFAEALVNVGVVIATTPFVLFFMLKDGHRFKEFSTNLMPPKFRKDFHDLLDKMSIQVGSYIQGQIIVSFCIGILLFIGYSIIGLDYSLILASIAAVTSVVPYIGPTIAISPAIIIALITSPFMLLKLVIVWTAVQFIEGHFISPNIMGKTLKIHPLTIIFILLSAGNLLGIVGVILGIPAYAILKVLVSHLYTMYKRRYNKYYGDDAGEYEITSDEEIR